MPVLLLLSWPVFCLLERWQGYLCVSIKTKTRWTEQTDVNRLRELDSLMERNTLWTFQTQYGTEKISCSTLKLASAVFSANPLIYSSLKAALSHYVLPPSMLYLCQKTHSRCRSLVNQRHSLLRYFPPFGTLLVGVLILYSQSKLLWHAEVYNTVIALHHLNSILNKQYIISLVGEKTVCFDFDFVWYCESGRNFLWRLIDKNILIVQSQCFHDRMFTQSFLFSLLIRWWGKIRVSSENIRKASLLLNNFLSCREEQLRREKKDHKNSFSLPKWSF